MTGLYCVTGLRDGDMLTLLMHCSSCPSCLWWSDSFLNKINSQSIRAVVVSIHDSPVLVLILILITSFITSSPDNCTRVCLSTAPVRHMAFGVPGGSTNMTYFVLCGGGLTAAVVYVSIRSGYRRWFVSPHFHRVCTVFDCCKQVLHMDFSGEEPELVLQRGQKKIFAIICINIHYLCCFPLYEPWSAALCAAALRFTSLSWFRQGNSVISRCYTLILHFLLQMPILLPPQRDSCLNWTLMTANINLTQFFSNFSSHFVSKAEKVHAEQPVFFLISS